MDQSPPAPSQSPKPDQEAAVPSQCQRFLDLHPQLADAKERFQSFYSTVGLKAVQEYLDSLQKIPSSLPTEISPEFIKWWCRLLNRQLQFDSVIIALEIKPDDPLRMELSQLAFVMQHPQLPHKTRTIISKVKPLYKIGRAPGLSQPP
ncbi:hypothetical protein PCASD_00747 [Puccinia coronata f. sp. avenae]|uniref:Uncharacterized protein n=1 Tax=Puccinia coronata f. sp. avenae TaxID=200324 RepID=A0A2N5VL74_9BASI|nr:hypothetical protein PCASD_00747 [Puccinia coronata f. sp. avenae]